MGRGRKRSPTALKLLRGTADRRWMAENEPQPPQGRPPKPSDLGAVASAKWDAVCCLLEGMGVITVADGEPIEQYARTYELWRRCETLIRQGGKGGGAFTEDGRTVKAPARLFKDLAGLLCRLESELGLTPSSRAKLEVPPPPGGKLTRFDSSPA